MPLKAQGEFTLMWQNIEKLKKGSGVWLGHHTLQVQLADTAAERRDLAGLREYVTGAEELASRYGHSLFLGIARRARGIEQLLDGNQALAEVNLQEALTLFHKAEARWQIGRTLFALGELARTRSMVGEAREYFSAALAHFETLRAVRNIAETRSALEGIA